MSGTKHQPAVKWTDDRARRLEQERERLWAALRENACGDGSCESFRAEAALFVLRGGSTHAIYAELVNRAAAKRPVLSLPLSIEEVSEIRERFGALPIGHELREGGLMLVEALVTALARNEESAPLGVPVGVESEEGTLDVERLARAMDDAAMGPTHEFNVIAARAIAATYARKPVTPDQE